MRTDNSTPLAQKIADVLRSPPEIGFSGDVLGEDLEVDSRSLPLLYTTEVAPVTFATGPMDMRRISRNMGVCAETLNLALCPDARCPMGALRIFGSSESWTFTWKLSQIRGFPADTRRARMPP